MYHPTYFKVEELVPPDLFGKHGQNSLYFLDDRITITLDRLRKYFGAVITVNNWHLGTGTLQRALTQRGYRTDINTGAPFSAHRFGRAADFDIAGMSALMFREWVKTHESATCLEYITRIEDGTTWNHIDCMGPPKTAGQSIAFFKK
jgi:hypothetical protein